MTYLLVISLSVELVVLNVRIELFWRPGPPYRDGVPGQTFEPHLGNVSWVPGQSLNFAVVQVEIAHAMSRKKENKIWFKITS